VCCLSLIPFVGILLFSSSLLSWLALLMSCLVLSCPVSPRLVLLHCLTFVLSYSCLDFLSCLIFVQSCLVAVWSQSLFCFVFVRLQIRSLGHIFWIHERGTRFVCLSVFLSVCLFVCLPVCGNEELSCKPK
jgi:hypothetical protein